MIGNEFVICFVLVLLSVLFGASMARWRWGRGAGLGGLFASSLFFPWGLMVLLLLVLLIRRREPGCCYKCHYDLTGNVSGTCPECGTNITGQE